MHDSVLCLGDFDGIHRGHRSVFEEAKKLGSWGVLLFDRNSKGKMVLTTLSEKLDILKELGADFAAVTAFDSDFSHQSPEEFVTFIKTEFNPRAVASGKDYRFGYKAAGDAELLRILCGKCGIQTIIADLAQDNGEPIKSTRIRELIIRGDLPRAAELLGMNYFVSGSVMPGFQNGRRLGFPTANIETADDKILPPDGVYYGKISGRKSVINIGKNPTFGAGKRTVEAYITDFHDNIYGKCLKAELIEKIRGEIKFESMQALAEQIKNDVKWVMERTD